MPKVKKGNRILTIEDSRVESYLKQGYDQIDESGQIVNHATGGKSVPVGEYNKLLEEFNKLKENSSGVSKEELEALKKENTSLKGKITKLEKAAKDAE